MGETRFHLNQSHSHRPGHLKASLGQVKGDLMMCLYFLDVGVQGLRVFWLEVRQMLPTRTE